MKQFHWISLTIICVIVGMTILIYSNMVNYYLAISSIGLVILFTIWCINNIIISRYKRQINQTFDRLSKYFKLDKSQSDKMILDFIEISHMVLEYNSKIFIPYFWYPKLTMIVVMENFFEDNKEKSEQYQYEIRDNKIKKIIQ